MSKVLRLCCSFVLLFYSITLFGTSSKPPRVNINSDDTPLSKAVKDSEDKIKNKIKAEKDKGNQACANADASADDDEKHQRVSKACNVAQFKGPKTTEISDLKDARGRAVGKRVKHKVKLYFDTPQQRADFGNPQLRDATRWDDFKYQGRPNIDLAGMPAGSQAANVRVRNMVLPTSEGINNDKDCVDRATGKHLGGYVRDDNLNKIDNPESCFDTAGKLKKTLVLTDDGSGNCKHDNGRVYSADECAELNYTTLQELIDEDGPEASGSPIDQDGDAFFDEDAPELNSANSPCALNGGTPLPGDTESCDLTQAARKKLNRDAMDRLPGGQKKKLFKIDENGSCDENAEGEYSCGQEPREIEIEETVDLRCPPNSEYVDGRCAVAPAESLMASAFLGVATNTSSQTDYAMMGFTFAPPVLEWGIKEQDNVCIFGFCFEIFYLRFGYEFEVAAGLRLPVQVSVTDIPSPNVQAQSESSVTATLEPADFKVSEYTAFCQKHHLDRSWWISDCNRFAFPEYFEGMMPDWMFASPGDRQGSEFVAQTTIFAGLQVRLFTIPVVNFAIDSSVNVPAMCSLYKMKQQIAEGSPADWIKLAANFGKNLNDTRNFMASLEGTLTNCASFTTPWGYDSSGEPRQFPFLTGSFAIPADCTREKLEAVAVGGESKPMCTGLKVTIYGATLGLGLELVPQAYSDLIQAQASTSGDAAPLSQKLRFHAVQGQSGAVTVGPISFDNHDATRDTASIQLDDFVYYLNRFGLQVNGIIELGGILSFIGNVATVPLVNVTFDLDDYGIPIPQHPGTGPVAVEVPVANYGLTVDAKPRPNDPMGVGNDTIRVKPGTSGIFEVWVKNEGTVPDTIDNFNIALSNRPQSAGPFVFGINRNNDFDCTDGKGGRLRGNPYDGVADFCYDAVGNVLPGLTELLDEDPQGPGAGDVASRDDDKDGIADEDPVDVWTATMSAPSVASVDPHSVAKTPVLLTIVPFRHPSTKPGNYPVRITADSQGARNLHLAAIDPSQVPRLGAEKIVNLLIEAFFDPQLTISPTEPKVKPGVPVTYVVEAVNGGNAPDAIGVQVLFADSDTLNCSLTLNGKAPGCPYRAQFTRIDPTNWTTVAELDTRFPATGAYEPLAAGNDSFAIHAPADWAGMQDTTYEFTFTATSTADTSSPAAKSQKTGRFTVTATKESMTRYLNLEVAEFLAELTKAADLGVRARGAQPVILHPVTMMTSKALEQILGGDLAGASKTLSSAIKVMQAVDNMVNGTDVPEPYGSDWKARSAAILADLNLAQASMIASQ